MCGADPPPFRRSVLVTVFVATAAFFTFDGISYGIMRASRDTLNLTLPPDYGYSHWLREPLYLKWQVLGLIPLLRWLPVLIAVCLAATLYVFILTEPFRICAAILAIHWTLTVVAMAIVSFAISTTVKLVGSAAPQSAPSTAQEQAPGFAAVPSQKRAATRPRPRRGQRPPAKAEPEKTPKSDEGSPAPGSDLAGAMASNEGAKGSALSSWQERLQELNQRLDPYIQPIKDASEPYTQYLPPAAQEFLDDGGWWLVLAALALVVAFWLRAMWRRCRRVLFGRKRRRKRPKESPLGIDLDLVADAMTDLGEQQITVRGQAGRLRLIVLAPAPSYVGDLEAEMADSLLDWLQPGLGDVVTADFPRRLVWPRHPSLDRFEQMFEQLVQIPEVKGRRTPWTMISGAAHLGRQSVYLGLAVYLDKTTYHRHIHVEKEKWNEVLGVQKVTEPD
jgi:hypothetical protein